MLYFDHRCKGSVCEMIVECVATTDCKQPAQKPRDCRLPAVWCTSPRQRRSWWTKHRCIDTSCGPDTRYSIHFSQLLRGMQSGCSLVRNDIHLLKPSLAAYTCNYLGIATRECQQRDSDIKASLPLYANCRKPVLHRRFEDIMRGAQV